MRDFSTFQNYYYSAIIVGLAIFGVAFLFWNFDWFFVRVWIVFSLIMGTTSELREIGEEKRRRKIKRKGNSK